MYRRGVASNNPACRLDDSSVTAVSGCVTQAAENNGPMIFAWMGMMQAINRHRVRESNTSRKTTHWGKRKLKRDR
jgi:hypothetical protein